MPVLQAAIAIHHPHPEHVEAFVGFIRRVEQAVAGAEGLLEFSSWRDMSEGHLVGLSRWESPEALSAAMPQIMSLSSERRAEWSAARDELLTMVEA